MRRLARELIYTELPHPCVSFVGCSRFRGFRELASIEENNFYIQVIHHLILISSILIGTQYWSDVFASPLNLLDTNQNLDTKHVQTK